MNLINNKGIYVTILMVMGCVALSGCGNTNEVKNKNVIIVTPAPTPVQEVEKIRKLSDKEALEMMINKYEFTEEELEGYDISLLLHDLGFDRPEYNPSPSWVREEFEYFKEEYAIGGEKNRVCQVKCVSLIFQPLALLAAV